MALRPGSATSEWEEAQELYSAAGRLRAVKTRRQEFWCWKK